MSAETLIDENISKNYFKEDKNLKGKIGIYYLLFILQIIPILNLILLPIVSMIFLGYFINNAHTRIFKPENSMPEWANMPKFLAIGFKATIAGIIIGLPANLIYMIFALPNMNSKNIAAAILIILLIIILFIIQLLYYTVAILAYITNFKIKSFFNIKAIKHIVKNELFGIFIIKISVNAIVATLLTMLLSITIIGIIAVPYITYKYLAIISDIQAQFIKHVFKIGQKNRI